jgi:hypothetical protein
MTMTHKDAQSVIQTARNRAAGKPLENNTRLFGDAGGKFTIKYHGTLIVDINKDGTFTLRNGGYNTSTTLERIRRYAPVSWNLFTERGEWFVRLQPNPKDPRPERVNREVPKPYTADDPGEEPVKSTEGCIAGQMRTIFHDDEIVHIFRKDKRVDDVIVKDSEGDSDYAFIDVKRSWVSHEYSGEAHPHGGWDEGWSKLDDNTNPHSKRFTNNDGEQVVYVQCPHCAEFDAIHGVWQKRMYGDRWGNGNFDQQTGYETYAKMMERFGTQEAWQEAYITDFRARRAYLKADREWDQRNRVPFYDGITVDSEGYAPRLRQTGPSPAKLRRHEREVAKIKKMIGKYVDGYIKALTKYMPMPGTGDCWFCSMKLGDMGSDHGHLFSHMQERYYVPSLVVNAMREAKRRDLGIHMLLHMNQETNTMGGPDNGKQPYDMVRRDLTKYLSKRCIPTAPTS